MKRGRLCLFPLVAFSATSCITATDEGLDVGTEESALTIRHPPPGDWNTYDCPADPPMNTTDPVRVGDSKTAADIIHDSDVYWANIVAYFPTDAAEASWITSGIENPRGLGGGFELWYLGDRAAALVQMYDLLAPVEPCRAGFYLSRVRAIAKALLSVRDDKRTTFPVHPMDRFRNAYMAAWGYSAADRDWVWTTDTVTAGLFTYPMAAFARRIAQNPTAFSADYQQDAIQFTTAVTETYISMRNGGVWLSDTSPWAYHRLPSTYSTLQCTDPNAGQCSGYRAGAGYPISWNEDLSLTKSLAEVAIAANSPLYRLSAEPNKYAILDAATIDAPKFIAKNVQFFVDNLRPQSLSDGSILYQWNHEYHSPGNPQPQNTQHGQFELASLAVIYEDKPAIDGMLAALNRPERIPLSTTTLTRFATTFLRLTWGWTGSDTNLLAVNVNGTGGRSLTTNANSECTGFIPLTQVDPWVWVRCRNTTFNPAVPNQVTPGNYAALLRYR